MTVNSSITTITPKKAKEMLELNTNNRPLSKAHVSFLAEQIKGGYWQFNGEAIKVSKSNRLMDGQHRLNAVIEANHPIKTIIITGLDDTIFDTLDTGKLRSHGDVLALKGETSVNNLSALLKMLHRYYENEWKEPKSRLTNVFVESLLEKYPAARDFAGKSPRSQLVKPLPLDFCYYVFSQIDAAKANDFMEKLITGNNISERSPITAVRNKLIDAALRQTPYKSDAQAVLIFKAWNAIRRGKSMQRPRYTIGETIETAV